MKKYYASLIALPLLFFASSAFAGSMTLAPATVVSGNEGTVSIAPSGFSTPYMVFYIFRSNGQNYWTSGEPSTTLIINATTLWSAISNLPTGTATDTYTVLSSGANSMSDVTGYFDPACYQQNYTVCTTALAGN